MTKHLPLLTFLLCTAQLLFSQQTKISGIVRDADLHSPLPFVNIRVANTSRGTTSDKNGRFNLYLSSGSYELVFTYIGYHTLKRKINIDSKNVILEVEMKQGEVVLDVLTVTPKDNPALAIIRKAIESKETKKEKLNNYKLTSHSKVVVDVKKLGSIGVAVNNIGLDSNTTMIMESQTDAYWQKPNYYKEIVRARKQSSFIPAASNLLISGFFITDFSRDIINMGGKKIVGPISNAGLTNYFYTLLGTTTLDNKKIYKIHISPIDDDDPLLDGTIYISDSTYQLMQIEVDLNKAARPPFIDSLSFRQQFALFDEEFWMPVDVAVHGTISVSTIITLNLNFEALSVLQNYEINKPFGDDFFDMTRIQIVPEADKRDSVYWQQHQAIPNSAQEIESYKKSDSIKIVMEEKRNEVDFTNIIFGKNFGADRTSIDIPGLISLYRFNRVEGHSVYFPIETTNLLDRLTRLDAHIGYGFNDRKIKYNFGAAYKLSTSPQYNLRANAFSSTSWIDKRYLTEGPFTTTLLNLLWKYDHKDYFYENGWNVSLNGNVLPIINATLGFHQSTYHNAIKNSDWSIFRHDRDYRNNPAIHEGTIRSLNVALRLDTRDYIDNAGELTRMGGGPGYHFLAVGAEVSEPKLITSDFTYKQYSVSLNGSFDLGRLGQTNYGLFGGLSSGSVPTQRIFNFIGSIPYLSSQWKFRTLGFREFSGDRIATLFVEHNFRDQIFRWLDIPLLKSSGWGLVFFGAAGWSDITDKSLALQTVPTQTAKTPFYEIGFGINQIFLLFRIDFAWRINHYREGKNFSVGVSIPFTGN